MPAAADIDEAIELVVENVLNQFATLPAAMTTWLVVFTDAIAAPGPAFDPAISDQRTVRNWFGPSLIAQSQIDLTDFGTTQISTSIVTEVVARMLFATKFARIGARITQPQEDSVVAQYNLAWA